ncbi:hypothetical protein MBANPS3_010077 [Mucor bainieri]
MSPPWTTLPQELVKKVFSEVDDKDTLELQCICKAWRSAAQEKLYTSITVPGDGGDKEQHLVQILCTPGNKARHYVKNIYISPLNYYNSSLNCMSLVAICSLCPNITMINTKRPTAKFYQLLCQLRKAQHLQKLQRISEPYMGATEDYIKIMLLLKNSATAITICNNINIDISKSNPIMEAIPLAKHLKEFVYLEELSELLDMCSSTKIRMVRLQPVDMKRAHPGRRLLTASQANVQPPRALHSVKELSISQAALPGDEDLQCIMKKFPALHRLSVDAGFPMESDLSDNEEQGRIIQSEDTAIAFVKYLWRIPYVNFEQLKTTPEIMSKIISQISKCNQVNSINLESTYGYELDLPILGAAKWKDNKEETAKSIELCIPPRLESLYQHATQAFSSQANTLHLNGSASWADLESAVVFPLDDRTKADSKALVSSLEYVINNYTGLKTLCLFSAILPPTYFNAAFKRRLRLDELMIRVCSMNAETWNMLSERLEYVASFKIQMPGWNGGYSLQENLYIPHTTLGNISLFEYYFRFVKISTDITTAYIDFKEELSGDEPERLTEQQYNEIRLGLEVPDEYCLKLVCKEWSSVSNPYDVSFHNN